MCYDLYIDSHIKNKAVTSVVPMADKTRDGCACVPHSPYRSWAVLKFDLARTSKQVREEFLTVFYQRFVRRLVFYIGKLSNKCDMQVFSFHCACEMGYHLEHNPLLKKEVRNIKFHWAGPTAHTSISLLRKMELQSLRVIISKETGKYLSAKEQEFRRYFHPKKGYHNCLTETLGIEELMALRGIQVVQVIHANRSTSQLRTDAERHALECLLRDKVTRPREEDDEE